MTGETGETGNDVTVLVAAYIAVWNERNPCTRRTLGAEVFTADAHYVDPNTSVRGRSAIDAYVAGWQEQFPGFGFVLGAVHGHHGLAHFEWSFASVRGGSAATGRDVVVLEQGRIATVYGFFD
ncbi:nuclear transport factor 2 family protein [Prauserella halophila]|uniref:Nuclear transport factor 2 family protein n=1 Tax=Prauserella halophila TaxID=185641 RepID=A0ABN1WGE2_9PSEU|nr:nuclear transport factor 2 family protein [Prauserella halophila]MCP2238392.1 SnoaL-like domain-containing protein [Prauserella halophila]